MTYGSALLNGYDVYSQINQARRFIGYCPQYDGLLGANVIELWAIQD